MEIPKKPPMVVNYRSPIWQQLTTAGASGSMFITYSTQNPASSHSFITLSLSIFFHSKKTPPNHPKKNSLNHK